MHCPLSQVKLPTKQPVSFKRLLYGFPLVLHVKLSFVMVQFWEPRAKEENKASEIADVFLYTSLICHDRLAPSYSIMLVLTPRSCTEPSPSLFLVKNSPHMEVQASVWSEQEKKGKYEKLTCMFLRNLFMDEDPSLGCRICQWKSQCTGLLAGGTFAGDVDMRMWAAWG